MAASVAAAAAPSASVHGTSSSSSALPSAAASVAAERKNSSSSSGSCLDASALGKDAQGILARIGGTGPGSVAGGRGDRGAGRLLSSAAAAQEAAAAAAATPDLRLRAPERERVAAPAFKLGAAIWATDGGLSQLSFQARKEAERKRKKLEGKKLEEEEEKAREEEERQRRRKKEKKGGGEGASKSPPRPYGDEPFKRLAAASRPVAFTSSVTPLSPSSSTANSHLSSLLLLLQSSGSLRSPRAMHECRLLSET